MKRYYLIILFFSLFINFLFAQKNNKEFLNELIDRWHYAASTADMENYFSYFAEDAIFIGTDSTEIWTKDEFYKWAKPYFDRGKAWTLKTNSRNIYLSEDKKTAWFDELLYSSAGTWRGSGVLIKHKDSWKIQHYVLSVTIPNEKMKAVSELLKDK